MKPNRLACHHKESGFTLIEIMITLVILGILAAVALPSFLDSMRKGRRAEAFAALAGIQQAQERWRGSHGDYGKNLNVPTDADTLPGIAANTPNGYYALVISDSSATGYTATATAQGAQAADTNCKLLAARVISGNLQYGSGLNAIDWSDPGRCWTK